MAKNQNAYAIANLKNNQPIYRPDMKRFILVFTILIAVASNAIAQTTMSDNQIIEFAKKEKAAGTDNKQIVVKLVQRGVSVQRLQQLRDKIQEEQEEDEPEGITTTDRSRKDNTNYSTRKSMQSKRSAKESASRTTSRLKNKKTQSKKTEKTNVKSDKKQSYAIKPDVKEKDEKQKEELPTEEDELIDILTFEEEEEEEEIQIFGHDIFNNESVSFEPNMNMATPDNYRLGAGDEVFIEIYGASQKTVKGKVTPDGTVTIDGFGPVHLAGLTVAAANARLRQQLGERYESSRIQLYVGQTKTIMVQVMGEVNFPGSYTLSAFSTVFHALYMAGGPNEIGTLRTIKVIRDGREITSVDVYDYILNGKLSGNIRLADNDVIIVAPYNALVYVDGEVKRPMFYEMTQSESVADVIKYAGGYTGNAYTKFIRLKRTQGTERSIHNIEEFQMPAFSLRDRDTIEVDRARERYANRVELKGEVFRPGYYQADGSIRTLKTLIEAADGVTEEAYLGRVVIHRRRPDRSLEVISANLGAIINGTAPDVALAKDDVIFVAKRSDMNIDHTVGIHGEVYDPGEYAWGENMTLEDLILHAGGLTDKASTVKVDVSRRILKPQATNKDSIRSHVFSFAMRDGFVVEGEGGFILQPYDAVFVRRSPESKMPEYVSIDGEVVFAGQYAIAKDNMRLSDLFKQAGGTTTQGYIHGARLERRINAEERLRMQVVLDKMLQEKEDVVNDARLDGHDIKLDTEAEMKKYKLGETYYVGIELDKAVENPGSIYDLALRDGDHIVIPEFTNTVAINGQVNMPNTVVYQKGKNKTYYIDQAGGYTQRAKKGHAYVIHMNGTMDIAKKATIEPGCEIIVPQKIGRKMSIAEVMSIGTASASVASMLATIANLIK